MNRGTPSWDIGRRCLDPLVQVQEGDDIVIVTADLPYVEKENIDLIVEEKSLLIKAEMKKDVRFESWGGVHRKISFNSFRKSIPLPAKIDPDETEAEFKRGVLKIKLRKKQGKKIDIK